jgi:hypothetical protein
MVQSLMNYKPPPGTPHTGIVRPQEGDLLMEEEIQELYRSDLSKCMTKANPAAFKELLRVIQFALDTKDFRLTLAPKRRDSLIWALKIHSDSDWAGDNDNRKSITGFLVSSLGAPILWRSQAQGRVNSDYDDEAFVTSMSDEWLTRDNNNRRSITGFIVFLLGAPIRWRSKA